MEKDYVFLMMAAKEINHNGAAPKLRRFLEIAREQGAVSAVDASRGHAIFQGGDDVMMNNVHDRSVVHAVFDDREKALNMLKALRDEDLGLSVVVSGLLDSVHRCCRQAGLERHTVFASLGIWGRKELLPRREVLEMHTMCGHGMVSAGLIEKVADEVRNGMCSPEEGAKNLYYPCTCGVFNTSRAADLIRRMV